MILDQLVAEAWARVARARENTPAEALRQTVASCPQPLDFASLRTPGVSLIAEVKRASPSRGVFANGLEPQRLARDYASGGADALSVLTEPSRFLGSLDDLCQVRDALTGAGLSRPLLRKDFIVDVYQLLEARLYGADAVLLIVAALDDAELAGLYQEAVDLGLTPLVEVHDEGDLARALVLEPTVLGINNRDLATFDVDLDTTARLRDQVPPGCLLVSESGIHGPEQVRRLAELGVDAMLVGEALVTATDPAARVRQLREAGR